ncbi:hypothetical protein D3C71_1845700 [compost metagenome]
MTFAGLKKCMPSTCAGRRVKPAIWSMSRRDVFDARMARGLQMASSAVKICRLTSMSSNAASITRSASRRSLMFRLVRMRAKRSSTCAAVSLPLDAVAA